MSAISPTPRRATSRPTRGAGSDHAFLYNAANRLEEVERNSLPEASTLTNALGERVVQDDAAAGIGHTHYDLSGRLIALP
ncbi:MAG: hypothetical protein WDZ84_10755 [Rhodovibrionaceae bacterium]